MSPGMHPGTLYIGRVIRAVSLPISRRNTANLKWVIRTTSHILWLVPKAWWEISWRFHSHFSTQIRKEPKQNRSINTDILSFAHYPYYPLCWDYPIDQIVINFFTTYPTQTFTSFSRSFVFWRPHCLLNRQIGNPSRTYKANRADVILSQRDLCGTPWCRESGCWEMNLEDVMSIGLMGWSPPASWPHH